MQTKSSRDKSQDMVINKIFIKKERERSALKYKDHFFWLERKEVSKLERNRKREVVFPAIKFFALEE